MKKYLYPLLAVLALPIVLGACSSDEETIVLSDNCQISSLTLGTMKRTIFGKTMAGKDSLYTTTFAGLLYPMTIDQRQHTIENLDSLPTHTLLEAVPVSVSFEGVLLWRKADLTALEDTTWTTFNANDSLDLRDSLHLRVVPASGHGERLYTLRTNVHRQEADSTLWDSLPASPALARIGERRALAWEDKLTLWGRDESGTLLCLQHDRTMEGDWVADPTTGAEDGLVGTLQQMGDALYMATTDGQVLTSTDGRTWTLLATLPATDGLRLVGASQDYLYALAQGRLLRSDGSIWEEERLDDAPENLPTGEVNGVFYRMKNGTPRMALIGSQNDSIRTATVWAKSWATGREAEEPWIYYTPNEADKFPCPMLEPLCILPYDGGLQALGGASRDRRYAALDSVFHSSDHGITWKVYDEDDMLVDAHIREAARQASHITAAVDADQYLWLIVDNRVWRGRINRLGFARNRD